MDPKAVIRSTLSASQLLPLIHLKRSGVRSRAGCASVKLVAIVRFVMEKAGMGYAKAVVRSIDLLGTLLTVTSSTHLLCKDFQTP